MYPNLYLDFKVQSILPPFINCVRSGTTANYFNSSGRLVQAAANTLRLEPKGLLIEPSATNLFKNSRDLTTWTLSGTATIGAASSIDGTLQNIRLTTSSTGAVSLSETLALTGLHTLSFYASKTTSRLLTVTFGGTTRIIELGPRQKYTLTATSPSSVSIAYSAVGSTATDSFILDAVQIEATAFATSPIHTNGSTVTRNADEVYLDINQAAANNWFTPTQGAFAVDCTTTKLYNEATVLHLVNTAAPTTNDVRLALERVTATKVKTEMGAVRSFEFFGACDSPGQQFRVGISITDGEQYVSLVGRSPISGTNTTDSLTLTSINRLYIGRNENGDNKFCGYMERLGFYSVFLEQLDLNNLTNV